MDNRVFSTTLQSLRKEKKVTQEQLATHLGVSPQAVSKWENGSYPEGDLLPAIADFFEVSIDYLYGRGGRDKSFEQIVFDKIREVSIKDFERDGNAETHRELLRLIKNIQWAIQTGSWINNETFFERPNDPLDYPKMGSVILDNLLYSYMGLREDNDFHLFLSSPEDKSIFEKLFRDTGKVETLFRFLSDRDHIAIVAYLYSLAQEEYAGVDTIAKATGVKKEKVSAALDELVHKICASPNPAITSVKEVTSDKENVIYGVNPGLGGLFIGLMMVAAEYTAPPEGYSMQINCRTKSWLEKKKK